MAYNMFLCLFIILLDFSLTQAQFRRPPPPRMGPPRFFRPPPQINGRPFGRPTNFMPFPQRPINQQNGFNPFNGQFNPAMNMIQRFPNGAPNAFGQPAPGLIPQGNTNEAPPTVVMGTLDPNRINGISNRFGLPTGRELVWQMSSPPSENGNNFGGVSNVLPGVQTGVPGIQPGFNGLGNFQQPQNALNRNVVVPNGINGNSIVPQTGFPQGLQNVVRPPGAQMPLVQQVPLINSQQLPVQLGNQQLQNQVVQNQQLPAGSSQFTGTGNNIQNARRTAGQFAALPNVPVLTPTGSSGSATSQSMSNLVTANNNQAQVTVPISPAIPGMEGVPREAIQTNGTFEYVEVITISDADGNVFYQGLNNTDADHRRIENILTEIQQNQTAEAHRLGRAGLATLPDSGMATGSAQAMGIDSSIPFGSGQGGPEIPEAQLQAHIKSVLEAQERQKLMTQDQRNSGSQTAMTSSSSSSSASASVSGSGSSLSVDANGFAPISGPVGFNPIAPPFMPNSFEPARNIPSRSPPPNFNPAQERFNQRMNNARSMSSRTSENNVRSGLPDFRRPDPMSSRRDQMMDSSRNSIETRSDFRINSDRMSSNPDRSGSRPQDRRGRVDGQGNTVTRIVQGLPSTRESSSRPLFTLSRTVWTI
ncbi:hypothetical protein KUTeg_001154 [Tegillarca granosa]|uniref:Uncharacterized protein n=1 Tax=Tegillarca granosa TaxID=220873 RepID=A0ABQ9FYV5_TEGGR|nr:hypothetical protein KUTeg_001154 [Tegillarca granosa]